MSSNPLDSDLISRRSLLKAAAGAGIVLAASSFARPGHAQGSDKIKIGFIGCGGRGTVNMQAALKGDKNLELVSMGDLFKDQLDANLRKLQEEFPDQVKVTADTTFIGWDAYEKVLATDCNLVFLTAPPHFRPQHFKAAIEAGKHVFMEKPVAVDPVGCRSIIETAAIADTKNLKVLAGTQARRMRSRIELAKRIQDGAIGDIIAVKCIRTGDAMRAWGPQTRPEGITDMEWQLKRWLFNTWLSGDFIAEMHIHELDIVNWMLGDNPPEKCRAMGGRIARTEDNFFDSYDHYTASYDYPNDIQVQYLGEQVDGTAHTTYERFYGTKGIAYTDWSVSRIEKGPVWTFEGENPEPTEQQHKDLIAAIRNDTPLNEAPRVAQSTLTAILGRISAQTGKELKYSWVAKSSKQELKPAQYAFGPGVEPVIAIPGKTPLV